MELTTVEQIIEAAQRDINNAKDADAIKSILMRASDQILEIAKDKAD